MILGYYFQILAHESSQNQNNLSQVELSTRYTRVESLTFKSSQVIENYDSSRTPVKS